MCNRGLRCVLLCRVVGNVVVRVVYTAGWLGLSKVRRCCLARRRGFLFWQGTGRFPCLGRKVSLKGVCKARAHSEQL